MGLDGFVDRDIDWVAIVYRRVRTASGMIEIRETMEDTNGIIVAWSPKAAELVALSEEELRECADARMAAFDKPVLSEADLSVDSDPFAGGSLVELAAQIEGYRAALLDNPFSSVEPGGPGLAELAGLDKAYAQSLRNYQLWSLIAEKLEDRKED